MNKIITVLFLIIYIGCYSIFFKSNNANTAIKIKAPQQIEEPFELKLQIEKLKDNQFNLAASIKLNEGDYIISPFSADSIYGNYTIAISESKNIILEKAIIEIPKSVAEYDPIVELLVRFIRVNTTLKQPLKIMQENDFEVSGLIEFVLEPICVPYDVEFLLSYRSGNLTVEKTKTFISKEYKMN